MFQFILLIHVFAAVCIIAMVLVQQGKGATMGAAFGSGASQTVFGSQGSGSFLFKLTGLFAALFFINCLGLGYLAAKTARENRLIPEPTAMTEMLSSSKSELQPPKQQL